ncbi:MAG: tyrosine-protein phosphatase [Clostridia bacterium]|nr:tyrosine-protein phosphatase [Clostridia bacterium]
MSAILRSTLNTRILPDGSGRFIRSDAPIHLTCEEINQLRNSGVTTIVDLRSPEEAAAKPCPLQHAEGFCYHLLPVTGGGNTPLSREHLHEVYRNMVDARMDEILTLLLHAPSRILYFCTAGKDRTGVVSALLLRRLGCSDDVIIRDYMASKSNLMDMLTAYAAAHPEVSLDVIVPREENISLLLHHTAEQSRA